MFNGFVDMAFDRFETTAGPTGTVSPLPLVTTTGCLTKTAGRWQLIRASDPSQSTVVHADESEIEAASTRPGGRRSFDLVGTADFVSADDLLEQGQRRLFTTGLTANATGVLREGRTVGVKGLLIQTPDGARLNLLSAWQIAEACR